jgi:glycosyltransferase involved in cell wall biosynthesis
VTGRRLRLLFALGFTPRLDAPHGGRAAAAVIRELAREHDVAVIYLRDASLPLVDDSLADACAVVEAVEPARDTTTTRKSLIRARLAASLARGVPIMVAHAHLPAFASLLRALAGRFDPDVIHFEPAEIAQYLRSVGQTRARCVVVVHEPGAAGAAERWQSFPPLKRAARWLDVLAWRRFERAVGARADLVVTLTARDEDAMRGVAGRVARVPLAIPTRDAPLNPIGSEPPSALFVGGYTHPPNEDAALRLLRSIWPRVREALPEATLELVGDSPTPAMLEAIGEGVVARGRVADLEPLLNAAAAVVLPIRLGGGMRVKSIEALSAGKAVVASRRAVEGLDVVDGRELLMAETDAQFVEATVRVLEDVELRRRLAGAARDWAEVHVSVEAVTSAYTRLYASLVEGSFDNEAEPAS